MFSALQPVLQVDFPYEYDLGLELGGTVCCLLYLVFFIIWIYILVWVYRDAERRGSSGILWVLIVFFLGIIGLIIWLIVRPSVRQPAQHHHHYYQQPAAPAAPPAANVQYCPHCRQPMRWIGQYGRWYCDYCRQYR